MLLLIIIDCMTRNILCTNNESSEIQAEVYIICKLSPIVNNRAAHLQGVKHVHKYLQGGGLQVLFT